MTLALRFPPAADWLDTDCLGGFATGTLDDICTRCGRLASTTRS